MQKYSFYDGVGRCGYCEPHFHKKSNPLGLLSFQGFRLCSVKMLMCALKIIFHIEKHLFVVLTFEQPSKERAECRWLGSARDAACLRQETKHRSGTGFVDILEPFPLHAEAHNRFVDRIIRTAI